MQLQILSLKLYQSPDFMSHFKMAPLQRFTLSHKSAPLTGTLKFKSLKKVVSCNPGCSSVTEPRVPESSCPPQLWSSCATVARRPTPPPAYQGSDAYECNLHKLPTPLTILIIADIILPLSSSICISHATSAWVATCIWMAPALAASADVQM